MSNSNEKKMEGLPITAFAIFPWDGAEAARNRRVCKAWRANIERVPRFARLMEWHLIDLTKSSELNNVLRGKYKQISPEVMLRGLETVLLKQDNLNVYKVAHQTRESINTPMDIIEPFAGEAFCRERIWYLQDKSNGDLIMVNDIYDGCPPELGIPHATWTSPVEECASALTWLEQQGLPNSLTWRFMRFPRGESHDIMKDMEFHRGSSFCLRFRFRGDWSSRIKRNILRSKHSLHSPLTDAELRYVTEYKRRTKKR